MLPTAALLLKLGKHLAFLATLFILGRASGRVDVDPFWIFGAATLASALHLASRALRMRSVRQLQSGSAKQ
jgi:arginine exporter protein ArgO